MGVGGSCADVKSGAKVSVKGTKSSDGGMVTASHVAIVSSAPADTVFEATGTLSAVNGSCPTACFVLTVTGITGSSFTVYKSASTAFVNVTCATLANGIKAYVKGTKNASGVVTASKVEKK